MVLETAALKPSMVIFGAGGHGRVVADAADAAGFEILGFLDERLPPGTPILTWRVLGSMSWLEGRKDVGVSHGIGSNVIRQRLTAELAARGRSFSTIIHPSAVVSKHARCDEGSVVLASVVLNAGVRVGKGAIINSGAVVEHDVTVGDFAHVASNGTLAGGARIDRLAMLGSSAAVLPARIIGEGSIVGAGAVVTHDIPPGCVAVGIPARVLRQVENDQ